MNFSRPAPGAPRRLRTTRRCTPTECLRVFRCGPCAALITVCRACDRGQLYCSAACRQQQRGPQLRAASRRYQQTERGRLQHAARQRAYWARRCAREPSSPPSLVQAPAPAQASSALLPPGPARPIAPNLPATQHGAKALDTATPAPSSIQPTCSPMGASQTQPRRQQPRCFACDRPSDWWINHFSLSKRRRRRRRAR